jgi:peptidoglycan hydrolase-like protein with peptidoglycan-binding domain
MPLRAPIAVLAASVLFSLAAASSAAPIASSSAVRDPNVAALQVGLRAKGVYSGPVDGLAGPGTVAAVRALGGNGLFGARTRARLGKLGKHPLGSRTVGGGSVGWDAAALQFMLAWHGFPSATVDGNFGSHSVAALEKFETWASLPPDGVAGPAVIAALKEPAQTCPIALRAPIGVPHADGFGPRGNRFHTGLDFPAATGTPVAAAASGRVVSAGDLGDGYGISVRIAHGNGVDTLYAHLSKASVSAGARVKTGQVVGAVGSTGHAHGSHLHFEVRIRDAAVDPLTGLR